jgi:general secretion pathway protein D
MVFLRPTIVRDAETMRNTTQQKYQYIREEELAATNSSVSGLDAFMKDVLGVDTVR